MLAASTGPTKAGTGCCGSPTDRLIGGLPGDSPAMSSVRRTKGERESTAGAGVWLGSREAVMVGIAVHIGEGCGPPRIRSGHITDGEVKTRLTIGFQGPGVRRSTVPAER